MCGILSLIRLNYEELFDVYFYNFMITALLLFWI